MASIQITIIITHDQSKHFEDLLERSARYSKTLCALLSIFYLSTSANPASIILYTPLRVELLFSQATDASLPGIKLFLLALVTRKVAIMVIRSRERASDRTEGNTERHPEDRRSDSAEKLYIIYRLLVTGYQAQQILLPGSIS